LFTFFFRTFPFFLYFLLLDFRRCTVDIFFAYSFTLLKVLSFSKFFLFLFPFVPLFLCATRRSTAFLYSPSSSNDRYQGSGASDDFPSLPLFPCAPQSPPSPRETRLPSVPSVPS